jgi:hypothetical protein
LYQLYELGVKRNPGLLTLEKIAAGHGMDISELLGPNIPKMARKAKSVATRRGERSGRKHAGKRAEDKKLAV